MLKQNENNHSEWAQAKSEEWRRRQVDVKKWEGRIRDYYKKTEMETGAFTSWGMKGVEAEHRALESVLAMNPDDVLKLLSKNENEINKTSIEFWETYEWPKQMIVEILGFCRTWVDMSGQKN